MAHTNLMQRLKAAFAIAGEANRRKVPVEQVIEERGNRDVSRREFLKRAAVAGAAVGAAALAPSRPAQAAAKAPRIVVVGAGLAGLTAAYRLKQAGYVAKVYEASGRVGGRCWTRRNDFDDDQIAEHGGELIDTGHTATQDLARELGLTLDNLVQAEQSGTEPFYYFDGVPYTFAQAAKDFQGLWDKLQQDLTDADYPTLYNQYTQRGWELDHMSVTDWIKESVPGGRKSKLGQLLDTAYNIEYGAECSEQSALNLIYLLGYQAPGGFQIFGESDEMYHIRGGNDQIPARLAKKLADQIVLGSQLVAIKQNIPGSFTLTFRQGGANTTTVTADKVVLTIPFSILRDSVDIAGAGFRPLKQQVIREMGMGTNSKFHLQFKDRHWQSLGSNGETYADTGYQNTWEVTRAQAGTPGILVNFTGGKVGASFDQGTTASRAKQFLSQLEPVLPGISAKWNGKATLDYWAGYKWTRGSYSYWQVGQYTKFAGVSAEPEGNCHFAGEHTSMDFQGFLNGAIESGERAASEVLADLKSLAHWQQGQAT